MEIWKNIINFEDSYQVSNCGNIRSKERKRQNGSGARIWQSKILKPLLSPEGYCYVNLWRKCKNKRLAVHRIVYETFIGRIPEDKNIDHVDNNPLNNKLENLQLLSVRQNVSKYYKQSIKSSKYIGVCHHRGKWQSSIRLDNGRIYLGRFLTEAEAGLAYQKALISNGLF